MQPWMPGSNGDEAMGDSDETPDWTGRAKGRAEANLGRARLTCKALEFLSRTLDFLGQDVLKPSQGRLLILVS